MSNLDKLRQRYNDIKSGVKTSSGGGSLEGKLIVKEGDTFTIRLVPIPEFDGQPLIEMYFHYGVPGSLGFLCPKRNWQESCPVCDFASKLWFNKEKTEEDEALAKELFAKERYSALVLVRGEEEKGLRWWQMSRKVHMEIADLIFNEDYIKKVGKERDIANVENGFDLKISCTKAAGARYTTIKAVIDSDPETGALSRGPVCDDMDEFNRMLEAAPSFYSQNERFTSADIQAKMDAGFSKDVDEKVAEKKASKKAKKPVDDSAIEDKFEALLKG